MKAYTLPQWTFLDAHSHAGDELKDRTVILHTRSASVIEIIDRDNDGFTAAAAVLKFNFKYISSLGEERMSAVLHYCATLDQNSDREYIKMEILRLCAMWYCDYCAWEDDNIRKDVFNEE
jgi:hypothetical protein